MQEDGREQRDDDRDPPCPQQAAEKGGSLERGPSGVGGGPDRDVAGLDDRPPLAPRRGLLHSGLDDHDVDRPWEQHRRGPGQRLRHGESRGSVRMAVSASVSTATLADAAVRVVQRPGYPCTRATVGQAWIREGLPQEYRWTLASPGKAEAGNGDLCHSS